MSKANIIIVAIVAIIAVVVIVLFSGKGDTESVHNEAGMAYDKYYVVRCPQGPAVACPVGLLPNECCNRFDLDPRYQSERIRDTGIPV